MEETKTVVRSIRADEATLEAFKQISAQFPSQAEALKQLVNLYELDAARSVAPGSADMLDALQGYLDGIQKAFIYAIELKQNAEANALEAVAAKLESKDKTIADLQEREGNYKTEIERLKAESESHAASEADLREHLQKAEEAAQRAEAALADKETIIAFKTQQLADLDEYRAKVAESAKLLATVKAENESLQASLSKERAAEELAVRAASELREQIKRLQTEHERDLQIAQKEAEAEKRQAAIEAREEAQAKIDAYIAKIEAKDEEIARLRTGSKPKGK